MNTASLKALPLLAALCLVAVGCGGGGVARPADPVEELADRGVTLSSAKLAVAKGFNGVKADLKGTAASAVVGSTTVVTLQAGARTLALAIPATTVAKGQTFKAVAAKYDEGAAKAWAAPAGTVKVSALAAGKATLDLSGFAFAPTTGAGAFKLTGKLVNVAFPTNPTPPPATGGPVALAFVKDANANAALAAFPANTKTFLVKNDILTSLAAQTSEAAPRALAITLQGACAVGDEFAIVGDEGGDEGDKVAGATYVEYLPGQTGAKTWAANSGKVKVLAVGASTMKVQMIDVAFKPLGLGDGAVGNFKANGTLAKG